MDPLLALLRDATATHRPALTLTDSRVVELLGFPADVLWWQQHAEAIASTGWTAEPLPDKGWVRFTPAGDVDPVDLLDLPPTVDVRVVISWDRGPAVGPGLYRRENAHGRIEIGQSVELAVEERTEGAAFATTATAWVHGEKRELDLADESARHLAYAAALLAG